jgi:hypothetical protein
MSEPIRIHKSTSNLVLAGERIGTFVGVAPSAEQPNKHITWTFACETCGATALINTKQLWRMRRKEQAPSCPCNWQPGGRRRDLRGERIGSFVGDRMLETPKGAYMAWEFRCHCGQARIFSVGEFAGYVRNNHIPSCTCGAGRSFGDVPSRRRRPGIASAAVRVELCSNNCGRPAAYACAFPLGGRLTGHDCGRSLCERCDIIFERKRLCGVHARTLMTALPPSAPASATGAGL